MSVYKIVGLCVSLFIGINAFGQTNTSDTTYTRYKPDETLINTFLAGIIPCDFYFR